jgi:thiamine kinase-like enzyme
MTDELSISPDEQYFTVEETGQKIINPYWFLKHEFAKRRDTTIDYFTSICHGDLNMQNILLDEDMNVYLIDFSETRPRSLVSDFARLEAIFMVDNAPLHDEKETEAYLKFICGFYNTVRIDQVPVVNYVGGHPDKVSKNVALTIKMREYAFKSVDQNTDPVPYCIALLEWIMPIVCYSSASVEHKRLSMIVSGLICENLINRL